MSLQSGGLGVGYYVLLVELGRAVTCQSVSPVLLWCRDNTYIFWEHCCSDCLWPLQVVSERKRTKAEQRERPRRKERERWEQTETQTGSSALVFTAGFSSPIHPCLVFFTSHLPFSAANVSHTAGGNYTWARRGSWTVDHMHTAYEHAQVRSHAVPSSKNKPFLLIATWEN